MPCIVALTAVELSTAIHTRALSCVEALVAYLVQIDRLNPKVNAIVALQNRDELMGLAQERDRQLSNGQSMGVLHGFPQAPKDLMPVRGMLTTRGSPIFKNNLTTNDAVVFDRMRAAGSIFIGRTNTPEFGLGGHTYNPVYGTTRNAFDPSKTAGGSSGGAAVAVALRMLPLADGSDMLGSLRTPAAFNNVYGLRTSFGCVPNGPTEEAFLHQQFSVVGPMARNIPDLAMLLSVQAGFDSRLPLTRRQDKPLLFRQMSEGNGLERDFRGKRIGWLGDLGGHLPTELGVMAQCVEAIKHFETVGCKVEAVTPNFDFERLWKAWLDLRSFMVCGANSALYEDATSRALLKPEAVWEIERGMGLSGQDIYRALRDRSAWYQVVRELFDKFDFLVMPTAQVFPFDAELDWPHKVDGHSMDSYHRWMQAVLPATMAGVPSLSAPAGLGSHGLPVGIQIIGPSQADFSVLQIGHAYDQASGYARQLSPLLG